MSLDTVLLALGPNDSKRVDALAETVVDIAGPANARVVLAHVFTEDEFEAASGRFEFEDASEVTPEDLVNRHTTVLDISEHFDEAGIEYDLTSRIGPHGQRIVDIARDERADLVVVGGRRRSPTGKAVFGSTAQQVMMDSPAPVTFVRGE